MKVLVIIMAGGPSEGLTVLTTVRSVGALPFGGKYRVIDFILSNCSNSKLFNVGVLTQYMPRSLKNHIGVGKPWELDRTRGGVTILQPYLGPGISGWQKGTADAVRQNFDFIDEQRVDVVLVLGANHVYKMDYRPMLRFHRDVGAEVTVGIRGVSPFETHRYGILTTDANQRITTFEEKPKRARDTIASMGVYAFNADLLREHLFANPSHLDFGRDILPNIIKKYKVYGYKYEGYWANVGTLQAYWEANMALLSEIPALDLYDPNWVIHTQSWEQPPAKIGSTAKAGGNLLANGSIVDGEVSHSVISSGVYVAEGAVVRDSIIMNDCKIGPGAVIEKSIIDKDVIIGENVEIGWGEDTYVPNKRYPDKLNTGLTVIGKGARIPKNLKIGHNVLIEPKTSPEAFKSEVIARGETVRAGK